MLKINIDNFSDEYFVNYFNYLIGRLYTGLCLKDEYSDTLVSHLESLNRELIGSAELISFLKGDARFISLLSKVQFLISHSDVDQKIFKKELFSAISIIKKLQKKYCNKEENFK